MNTVSMIQFGATLTDRADGKKVAKKILEDNSLPLELDFMDVVSLGSSFGDEVVLAVAEKQGQELRVLNANGVIKNSIMRIIEEKSINITFV